MIYTHAHQECIHKRTSLAQGRKRVEREREKREQQTKKKKTCYRSINSYRLQKTKTLLLLLLRHANSNLTYSLRCFVLLKLMREKI